ncbi:MAG: hypothetical protein WC849_02630 [Candidatus Paceibacterota bacterium]
MSLIEIILSIAIVIVILLITINLFSNYNEKQVLDNSTEKVLSLLKEARSLTLSSMADSFYGVHMEQGFVTLFKGGVYVQNNPENKVNKIDEKTKISLISLNGGGSDVVFQKLTGKTNQYGTINISLFDLSKTKVLQINQTGLIEKN